MPSFTKRINLEDTGFFEFEFTEVNTPSQVKFHISVAGRAGRIYHFEMQKIVEAWKICESPQPPEWIKSIESQLAEAIIRNLN